MLNIMTVFQAEISSPTCRVCKTLRTGCNLVRQQNGSVNQALTLRPTIALPKQKHFWIPASSLVVLMLVCVIAAPQQANGQGTLASLPGLPADVAIQPKLNEQVPLNLVFRDLNL